MRKKHGYFVLFGRSGGGKSTEAAKTFQGSISILSAPNNQHHYERWLESEEGRASGLKMPVRTIVLDRCVMTDTANPTKPYMVAGADGLPSILPQRPLLESVISGPIRKSLLEFYQGKPLTYQNMIIDEAGTFWTRCFNEIQAVTFNKDGTKLDPLGAFNAGEKWSTWLIDLLRQGTTAGMNVVIIAHDSEPVPEKDKQGGPKFFSQGVMKQICADADGVLHRVMRDPLPQLSLGADQKPEELMAALAAVKNAPTELLWMLYASEHWQAKLRGLPPNMFDKVQKMALGEILPLAGWSP